MKSCKFLSLLLVLTLVLSTLPFPVIALESDYDSDDTTIFADNADTTSSDNEDEKSDIDEAAIRDFVTRLYSICLNREPDSIGLDGWTKSLVDKQATGCSVAYGFVFSPEFQGLQVTNSEYVRYMYDAFFGRKPDTEGFNYWVDLLDKGMTREEIYCGFANSLEFSNLCKSFGVVRGYHVLGNDFNKNALVNLFVERLYNVVLNRTCDDEGMAGWTTYLVDHSKSGYEVAYGFVFSPEFINRNLCDNHFVEVMYEAFLGRSSDATGKAYWVDFLVNGSTRKEIFNGFAGSIEFAAICDSYGIEVGSIDKTPVTDMPASGPCTMCEEEQQGAATPTVNPTNNPVNTPVVTEEPLIIPTTPSVSFGEEEPTQSITNEVTPTSTPTPTVGEVTSVPTNTVTPEPTVTPTNTVTPVATNTPTPTPTPTKKPTNTPTPTPTPTKVPTNTPTPTPTKKPTNTPTPTPTPTKVPTNTPTPTPTKKPTNTPTPTPTPTKKPTNTPTPTPTPTKKPTNTPTPTPTPTKKPTNTPTPTPSPTTVVETSIALNVTSADLNIWETLDLSVVPAQADTTISWSSSDPLVARVDDKGYVEALRVGTATITAKTSEQKTATCVITVTDSYEDFNARFKVPYVATYYFNPKPSINDTIQIPLYISDYENSDYMFEDSSVTLDIIYKVDNNPEMTVKNVPLGDYTITLGKLSEGMHTFSVKVRDNRTGLDSAVLYNDLWVLKNSTSETVAGKTYVMQQSDLTKYSIVLQNKNATTGQFTPELTEAQCLNNRNGLNQMFTDLKANGYTKVVLVKGIYRIDGEQRPGTPDSQPSSVWIPTNFTVDMNGSTFKLNTITSENPGCIVSFYDTVDSHLTNGTLEGDRFERKALGLETGTLGERISTVRMYGGKYNSIINVNVQNSTSYAFFKTYTYPTRNVIRSYESGAIDPATGNLVSAPGCSTSSYMDLSEWRKNDQLDKYMYVGHPDGLRGVWSDSVIVYVSFYGANKNYLETVTAMQFRKILVPDNAQYCRVTVLGTNIDTGYNGECNLAIYDHHLGDYCEVKNCNFIDTRACAMAPAVACHILIEGCTFTRCGNSITAIAVDFEDGGEECMDVFYRNNTVLESAGNGTVISNRGFNHIFENCTNHSFEFRHGVYGLTVRNMTDPRTSVTFQLGDRKHQAYMRVYDNNFSVYRSENRAQNGKWTMDFIIRDCTISTESFNNLNDRMRFENCTITSLGGGNSVFNNCTIQSLDRGNIAGELYFYNCTFKNLGQGDPFLRWTWQSDFNRVFENCTFEGTTRMNGACSSALFRGCVFNNLEYMASATLNSTTTSIVFDSCEINSSAGSLLTTGPLSSYAGYINVIFKNCTITHTGNNLINLFAKPIDESQIVFVNCVINKTSGVLVTGNNGFNVAGSLGSQFQQYANRAAIKIIFNKTPVNPNLPIDTKNVNTNWAKIIYEN